MANGRSFRRKGVVPLTRRFTHLADQGAQQRAAQTQLHQQLYPAQRQLAAEARRRLPGRRLVWRRSETPPPTKET